MLPYWYNQMISHKLGRTFQVMDCASKFLKLFVKLISFLDMFPLLYLSVYHDILSVDHDIFNLYVPTVFNCESFYT